MPSPTRCRLRVQKTRAASTAWLVWTLFCMQYIVITAAEEPQALRVAAMNEKELEAMKQLLHKLRTPPAIPPSPPAPPCPPHPPVPPPSPPPSPPSPPPPPPMLVWDLERLPKGWTAFADGGDFGWTWNAGPTPTVLTGPNHDHSSEALATGRRTRNGHYYYIESSSPRRKGDEAWMQGPLPASCTLAVSFWYHMEGVSMGRIEVWLRGDGREDRWQNVWRVEGPNPRGWRAADIWLHPAMLGGTIRFVGVVGDGYLSDMAIDDIGFVECLPPPPPPPPPPFPPVGVRWAACQDFCSALNADSHCDDDKCSMCPFCVATSVDGPSADSARTPCCSWDKCGTCPPTGYCTSRNKCELECHGHWCRELSGIPL